MCEWTTEELDGAEAPPSTALSEVWACVGSLDDENVPVVRAMARELLAARARLALLNSEIVYARRRIDAAERGRFAAVQLAAQAHYQAKAIMEWTAPAADIQRKERERAPLYIPITEEEMRAIEAHGLLRKNGNAP